MSKKVFFIFESVRKKSFFIILGLSVVVTYGVAFGEGLIGGHFLSYGGVPLRFASGSFLGGSTDNIILVVDIAFWFVVIWVIWKATSYLSGRAGR